MEASTYIAVLMLALLSGATTVIGVWLAIYVSRSITWIAVGIGFSAGIMLLISVFELIPESLAAATPVSVLLSVAAGVMLIGVLNYVLPHSHMFKEHGLFAGDVMRSAYLVTFGLIVHDFPEGFAMANAYIASPATGIAVALAIALHNIPEEFAMAVPVVASKNRRLLFRAALLSGLAEPAGAVIGLLAARSDPELVPLFMAFAAGAMIFIAIHELIPMAQRYGKIIFFAAGMVASVAVYLLLLKVFP